MDNPLDLSLLNENELESLQLLKEKFVKFPEDYLHDEHYLMHWLKARKFDVDHAEAMLLNHLRYRKALGMDNPSYPDIQPHPLVAKYYPHGVFGHDKEGHPVAYFPIGSVDSKGITHTVKNSDTFKGVFYWQEERMRNCAEASKKFGKRIQQALYVLDMKGLGGRHLWKPGLDVQLKITRIVEQHTPEIMYKVYVINAPKIFNVFYKMILPIIDENTRRKIHVFDENYQDALLDIIDESQLPVCYGGKAVDDFGDPKCGQHIIYGGPVPQDVHYVKSKDEPTDDELTELNIRRSSQILLPLTVQSVGSVINWYFKCDAAFDVGFGIYRKLNDRHDNVKDMDMVVPYFRLLTAYVPETGQYIVKSAGEYIVQFDNSYSWLYGKTVKYRLDVRNKDDYL